MKIYFSLGGMDDTSFSYKVFGGEGSQRIFPFLPWKGSIEAIIESNRLLNRIFDGTKDTFLWRGNALFPIIYHRLQMKKRIPSLWANWVHNAEQQLLSPLLEFPVGIFPYFFFFPVSLLLSYGKWAEGRGVSQESFFPFLFCPPFCRGEGWGEGKGTFLAVPPPLFLLFQVLSFPTLCCAQISGRRKKEHKLWELPLYNKVPSTVYFCLLHVLYSYRSREYCLLLSVLFIYRFRRSFPGTMNITDRNKKQKNLTAAKSGDILPSQFRLKKAPYLQKAP